MSSLCWFLLFSVVVFHGAEGGVCIDGELDSINPLEWVVLRNRNLRPKLWNARLVNVAVHQNNRHNGVQALVHTRSRETYIYGPSNTYGTDAGNDHVRQLTEIRGRDIKDVQFGLNFVAVLDYGGRLWTAGQNNHGQLSRGTTKRTILTKVTLPGRVEQIAVGNHHCVALTSDGQLFSWGHRHLGSLGFIGHYATNPKPTSFTLGAGVSRPSKICCGAYTCAALTQHSGVYSWGDPMNIGRRNDSRVPGRVRGIPSDDNIIKLSCGINHTVAVSSSGNVYGWGRNDHGELLQNPSGETYASHLLVQARDAVAGRFITVVRNESGDSIYFGRHDGEDHRTEQSTNSHSPRDLMKDSELGPETKGAVRVCG